ncbi:hypothetical protein [Streptomyces nigra]|uniref:hypothetical protein n=1 Tax=Streptomyces nigra TaxID=1827580 RepID=UPI00368A2AF2
MSSDGHRRRGAAWPVRLRGLRRLAATVDEVLRHGRPRGLRRLAVTANDVPRAPDGRAAFVA